MARARNVLTHDRILQAALALADAEGLEALSMRRLGAELGVEAMSLYRHVPSKEALLDDMVDAIVRGWVDPVETHTGDWRQLVGAIMHRAHQIMLSRPWSIELLTLRPRVGDARLRYAETVTTALLTAGFSPQLAHHGLHIVDGAIMGFTAQQAHRPTAAALGGRAQALAEGALSEQYPGISRTIRQHHDHDEEYALMVDLVIDGLARLRDGRVPSRHGSGADYPLSFS